MSTPQIIMGDIELSIEEIEASMREASIDEAPMRAMSRKVNGLLASPYAKVDKGYSPPFLVSLEISSNRRLKLSSSMKLCNTKPFRMSGKNPIHQPRSSVMASECR